MIRTLYWLCDAMGINFFCDENITKAIYRTIDSFGYKVSSIRELDMMGIKNGALISFLENDDYTFITFDKDFLDSLFMLKNGIIIIDIKPNRDSFVIPILEKFLKLLKENRINLSNQKIILNYEFIEEFTQPN